MTPEQMVGCALAVVVMLVGLVGSVIPGIPGCPLIFVAAFLHRLYFGVHGVGWFVLILLFFLMLFSIVVDFLAGMLGAKKFGATWKGITGATIGAIVGLFFGFIGLFVGPFIGAVIGEILGGRQFGDSAKAGVGAFIGMILGVAGKIACSVAMIGLFIFSAFYNSR